MTPPQRIVFCVREHVPGSAIVAHLHGREVAVVHDVRLCVPLIAPRPCAEMRRLLEQRLCDQHGRPIIEVDPLPHHPTKGS